MTVFRDAWGIPHIRAGSVLELAFEQGRVTSLDRAEQLEIERLRGEGRTASVLGEAGVEWDVFARRSRIADVARRAFAVLDEESRSFVRSYVDGVNAAGPGTWQPWTPLAVFLVQQIHFGPFPSKLWRRELERAIGPDEARLFRTEGLPGGSNAFVVGPQATASGLPLVAGDPHRAYETPNIYLQVRLACPEFDVVGFTFPGVPGVQHFAHAGDVAWGITNAVADYQDLYDERLERRGDEVWALGPDGWERAEVDQETVQVLDGEPVPVEVVVTARGPVILGSVDSGEAQSLRSPSYLLGDLGFAALLPLLRATTVADVDAAMDHWVEPVNNVVIGDRTGAVLHRVAGRVPAREGDAWSGWAPLPRTAVAPDGRFVTANQRASAAYDLIGDEFAPSFRADRIGSLLDEHPALTTAEAGAVLGDTWQNAGRLLLGLVESLEDLSTAGRRVQTLLADWDGHMEVDAPGAALFGAVRADVVDRICAQPVLAPLRDGSPYGAMYGPWFHLPTRVAVCLHVLLAAERPLGLDPRALVRDAVEAVAAAGEPLPWGDRHRFRAFPPADLPPTPLPGDHDAVFAAGWLPGDGLSLRGPVARYVWDLADREASHWVVPLGASGDPHHPHHADQHATWAAGGLLPVVTDWSLLTEETP